MSELSVASWNSVKIGHGKAPRESFTNLPQDYRLSDSNVYWESCINKNGGFKFDRL